jgi:cobalt-zinc-cadmium efflux system outer membrane protein
VFTLSLAGSALAQELGVGSVPPRPNQQAQTNLQLGLLAAMTMAERNAPELREPIAERQSVDAFKSAASRWVHRPPRATLSLGPRRIAGGGQMGWDATIGIFQELSLGGYGHQLEGYAHAIEQRAHSNLAAVQRDAKVRAGLFWVDARVAREILAIRKDALGGAEATLRIAEARAGVGKSSPAEAALARALLGSVEASVLSAQGDITVADAQLRYVCGIELHDPIEVVGSIQSSAQPIDENVVRQRALTEAPELTALRAHARLLERSVGLGRAQSKPHIELGPSVTHEGTGDWIVAGHLSLPLPGVDPYAADNAQRTLEANLAKAHTTVAEQAALREIEIALHEREHALNLRDSLLKGTVEPSQAAVREYQIQYEVGRIDLTTLLAARRELLSARERWAAASADVIRAEVRLLRWINPAHLRGIF